MTYIDTKVAYNIASPRIDKEKSPHKKRTLNPEVKSLKDILYNRYLAIPEYQRPYKWQAKHVKQLIDDIVLYQKKSAYRIGTAVLHKEKEKETLNIVDGQQRLITLSLVAHALYENVSTKEFALKYGGQKPLTLLKSSFENTLSQINIVNNYKEIEREIKNFKEEEVRFFFTKCELVCITLSNISEAFQFFDSQNARGKDLAPHDLLKAFHLREMNLLSESERVICIKDWESRNDDDLDNLFSQYLFRIRRWSKRRQGRYLSKSNSSTFKGISLEKAPDYPFIYPLKINNVFTDEFNQHLHRKIDNSQKAYPFQIDQVVINGKRFFEMIAFYQEKIRLIKATHKPKYLNDKKFDNEDFIKKLLFLGEIDRDSYVFKILKTLAIYEGRNRSGDQYVRTLFDCALIYYTDKFGNKDLERVIVKIFIWAYSKRLVHHSVQLASIDNYAIGWNSIFVIIREASQPKEVYRINLESIQTINASKIARIKELFKLLNYYDGE